jgi:DedD protein
MQEGAKKRLVGAIAIVALAVIFVPMFFEDEPPAALPPVPAIIPDEPLVDERFRAESFLTPSESGLGSLDEETWLDPGSLPMPRGASADPVDEVRFEQPSIDVGDPVAAPAAPVEAPSLPDAPPPMAADDGMPSWIIQVASLGTSAGAQELADELRGEGYSAFVESAEVGGRLFYRVRVGPEVDRARADKTAAQLGRKYKDPFVQRYP